jgi:hypothetical protein
MLTKTETSLHQALALVANVQLRRWGEEIVVEGYDDPPRRHRIEIVFGKCREFRWSVYAGDASQDDVADVIGFAPGGAEDRDPAILTTDLFELSVLYGSSEVRQPASMAEPGVAKLIAD